MSNGAIPITEGSLTATARQNSDKIEYGGLSFGQSEFIFDICLERFFLINSVHSETARPVRGIKHRLDSGSQMLLLVSAR